MLLMLKAPHHVAVRLEGCRKAFALNGIEVPAKAQH